MILRLAARSGSLGYSPCGCCVPVIDLIAIFDRGGDPRLVDQSLPPLPSEAWTGRDAPEVARPGFCVRFLEHDVGPPAHAELDGRHIYVMGSVYPRNCADAQPLAAVDLLSACTSDLPALLARTKGNFVLLFVDHQTGRCDLASSRLNVSPFYYATDGERLIFSTSLVSLTSVLRRTLQIDRVGVAELALFNYPLGNRTYVRGVNMLRPAEIVRASLSGLHVDKWWDVRTLYEPERLSEEDALERGSQLLRQAVNMAGSDAGQLRVSFTSGFDSRVMLAVLNRLPSELLAYSFGIPGSVNVSIPARISKQLGITFEPVYLDDDYTNRYDDYALRALLLSDCLSTVERANYPYAFERTAGFSPIVVTGLFGSELLRTFQNIGHIVSSDLVQVHLSPEPREVIRGLADSPNGRYFARPLLSEALEELEVDVMTALHDRFGDLPRDQRFYMFLLSEGLRRYFGAEVHMERPWGINRFPFLDEEFVEFAFRSPFAGVHSQTLSPTIGNRFRSQYFYAHLIRRYRPELLRATTDHGYPPADLLSRLPLLRIGPKIFLMRGRQRLFGYREFKTEEWTASLYAHELFKKPASDEFFSPAFAQEFQSGVWLERRLDFARAASFKLWMERIH
jgi:hypothetical protein